MNEHALSTDSEKDLIVHYLDFVFEERDESK